MTDNKVLRGLVALIKGAQGRPFTVAEKAELLIRAETLANIEKWEKEQQP